MFLINRILWGRKPLLISRTGSIYMERAKVIYLDAYRKIMPPRQRDLLAMIEGHLAEAGLLGKNPCTCASDKVEACSQVEECWQPWNDGADSESAEGK